MRSKLAGVLVAALSVAAVTGVNFPLRHTVPVVSTGVLYLLAVLLVSSYWGPWLGLLTSVASAAAFNFFHIPPTGTFTVGDPQNWVALAVFFVAALVVSGLAELARGRARDAEERRREADLAAALAHILLSERRTEESLPVAAHRIAEMVELDSAAIRLGWVDGDERTLAIPLVESSLRVATLLVPRRLSEHQRDRLEGRIAPPLTALVSAALRRQRLEDELTDAKAVRRSDELKTALLRSVSHDLRSPLTAIRTAASVLSSESISRGERAEMADLIREESDRLTRLVSNLLDLSRLEAGTAEPRRQWCSIAEIVEAAIEAAHLRGLKLDVELDPDLPMVRADSAQLERAVANLLDNAGRHAGGQPVSVRARTDINRLFVRISDQGPGIPKELQRRIFEPFYRADGGTGSGLGLAIAKGFVEANGGRLRAQSLPGQGATFVIELPLEQPAAQEPRKALT